MFTFHPLHLSDKEYVASAASSFSKSDWQFPCKLLLLLAWIVMHLVILMSTVHGWAWLMPLFWWKFLVSFLVEWVCCGIMTSLLFVIHVVVTSLSTYSQCGFFPSLLHCSSHLLHGDIIEIFNFPSFLTIFNILSILFPSTLVLCQCILSWFTGNV